MNVKTGSMRLSFILLLFLLSASCSKSSGDDMSPVIVINSPAANADVAADAVVHITATITDDDEIHEVALEITNKTDNQVVNHYHYHPDVKSFNINESFTALAGKTYKIEIEADDHSGNKSEKEIEIHSH